MNRLLMHLFKTHARSTFWRIALVKVMVLFQVHIKRCEICAKCCS